jgi:pimeloyl-ACP methyl ester carboxylesterase
MGVMSNRIRSDFIVVDDVRTHYLEAGCGYPVVLLHSGEFGASAELSWEYNIDALAQRFRVIAPDWLGFGQTDKLYDFAQGSGRRVRHMQRFLSAIDVQSAFFIASSMGASVLARQVAARSGAFPVRAMVLSAGGGFVPNNSFRQDVVDYDCTIDSMRKIVSVLFESPCWPTDDEYVRRRYESSLTLGAWEATAAARFRSPTSSPRTAEGQPDITPYENIDCRTLVVAGAQDKLRQPGYADEIVARIPRSELQVYDKCGHFPHVELAARFNADALDFLGRCMESRDA